MRSATIIGGAPAHGAEEFYRALVLEADLLVAADSGASVCRIADRVPDLIAGDLDSIPHEVLEWAERGGSVLLRAPVDKDESDLDLALRAAREAGCGEVTVAAAWSARLDHTIAAFGSVAAALGLVVDIVDPGLAGWILRPGTRPSITIGPRGAGFSLFALSAPATVTTRGMCYELASGTLEPLSSRGLSNVIALDTATVQVHDGTLLVLSSPAGEGPVVTRTTGG